MRRLRRPDGEIAIPASTWNELPFDCARLARSRRGGAVEHYLDEVVLAVAISYPVLGYEQQATDWHALERARLVAAGRTPPFVDGRIVAIAPVNGLILVPSNNAEFRDLRNLQVRS